MQQRLFPLSGIVPRSGMHKRGEKLINSLNDKSKNLANWFPCLSTIIKLTVN